MRDVRGNDVAMIFQDSLTSLNPTMTIGEADRRAGPPSPRGVRRRGGSTEPAEMLGLVGFPHPRTNSGPTRTSSRAASASG
jgi:peptide/nickel transport system ATP-binding protein